MPLQPVQLISMGSFLGSLPWPPSAQPDQAKRGDAAGRGTLAFKMRSAMDADDRPALATVLPVVASHVADKSGANRVVRIELIVFRLHERRLEANELSHP